MKFSDAARAQHRRQTFYTVWLVGPGSERERLSSTQSKSGVGLIRLLQREVVQALLKRRFADADQITFKKHGDALVLSNGWKIEFGGTLRQEAT